MRYGFWLPVFGGWLRNLDDEKMETSWAYTRTLCQRAEQLGFDLTLIAELNLNDIKGVEAPSLDAWSTAAALAAVTEKLELMVAVRPTFHNPALLAKQAANIDQISGGRLSASTSFQVGGATKPPSTASPSMSTSSATPAPPNGSTCSTAAGLEVKRDKASLTKAPLYDIQENVLSPKPARRA